MGGLIGVILGVYIYAKRNKENFFDLLDLYMSILPLGQAIGRIGCYFNGCCYGKEYTGIIAVKYVIDGKMTWVFPTWFVESAFCFLLFMTMFLISKKTYCGLYASIYLMSYSLFRFFLEYYRGDAIRGIYGGLSTSQYLSMYIFVLGVFILGKSNQIKEKNIIIRGRS